METQRDGSSETQVPRRDAEIDDEMRVDRLMNAGSMAEAVALARELLERHPDWITGYQKLGLIALREKDFDGAVVEYRRGLVAAERLGDPDDADMLNSNVTAALFHAKRYTEAEASCACIIGIDDPGTAELVNAFRARICLRKGEFAAARDRALAFPDDCPDRAFVLALACLGLGDEAEARRWFAVGAAAHPRVVEMLAAGEVRYASFHDPAGSIAAVTLEDVASGPAGWRQWLDGRLA